MSVDFPDYRHAVTRPASKSQDNLLSASQPDDIRYYKGIAAKVNLDASGIGFCDFGFGLFGGWAGGGSSENDTRPRRRMWYGHMFFFDFFSVRQEGVDESAWKNPSFVTFLKEPALRLASGYNYVRAGARSEKNREDVVKYLGNQSLTDCIFQEDCANRNSLRRMCSIQASYLCGGTDKDCIVLWNTVDGVNYMEKLGKMVNRAKQNMRTKILFTGVVEEMEASMDLLEALLPTYFEGISEESRTIEILGKEGGGDFERNFKKEGGAMNVAPDYQRPGGREIDRIKQQEMCWADYEVYEYANTLLKERKGQCKKVKWHRGRNCEL